MERDPPRDDETPKERADRELIELLNELRVVLPGVTVLLAFLLAVPFAKGWTRITSFQRDVFVVAFLATAVSVALLTAPSSYHRLRFRAGHKERMVRVGNRLSATGRGLPLTRVWRRASALRRQAALKCVATDAAHVTR